MRNSSSRARPASKLILNAQSDVLQLTYLRTPTSEPRSAPPIEFHACLPNDLDWYLETYPWNPSPKNQKRARKHLRDARFWGRMLFECIFKGQALHYFYEATRFGLDHCTIVIVSNSSGILSMPWELLYCPGYDYLALQVKGFYRTLNTRGMPQHLSCRSKDNCVRILMIIPRPNGSADELSPYHMARLLLEDLKGLIGRKKVVFKILKPATINQLEWELNTKSWQIVHYDGHGTPGSLAFEKSHGGAEYVTGDRLARCLRNGRVPIFTFDACNSTSYGIRTYGGNKSRKSSESTEEDFMPSIPSCVIEMGATAVVGMSYKVLSGSTINFFVRFYKQLFQGKSVAEAVSSARRMMTTKPYRDVTGVERTYLEDWIAPVLYQQEGCEVLVKATKSGTDWEADHSNGKQSFNSVLERKRLLGFPPMGSYIFLGREFEMLGIEEHLQQFQVVIMTGMKGVGKTRLAYELGRWLVLTSDRHRVFFTSFENRDGVQRTVSLVGNSCWGRENFEKLSKEDQEQKVIRYLCRRPCLMIWDRFEQRKRKRHPLKGGKGDDSDKVSAFLRSLQRGKTQILILSRRNVKRLAVPFTQKHLEGLERDAAVEFCEQVLDQAGVVLPEYHETRRLAKMLDGNPLCMSQVLPKLSNMDPDELAAVIQKYLEKTSGVFVT